MVNISLADSYYKRAKIRAEILKEFVKREDFADVVREAQEIVELLQKAILIKVGIEPPKWHDVSDIILENIDRFPESVREKLRKLKTESKWLRSQRETAFYGSMDIIPEEYYTEKDAQRAIDTVKGYLSIAKSVMNET